MNNQQAFILGFVKRAAQYGVDQYTALNLLKQSGELKGDQYKLDVDHDGKIEAEDLRKLRARKKKVAADGTPVSTGTVSTGTVSGGGVSRRPKPVGVENPDWKQQFKNLWNALKGNPPASAGTYNHEYKK